MMKDWEAYEKLYGPLVFVVPHYKEKVEDEMAWREVQKYIDGFIVKAGFETESEYLF